MHLKRYWNNCIPIQAVLSIMAILIMSSCGSTLKTTSSVPVHHPPAVASHQPPAPSPKLVVIAKPKPPVIVKPDTITLENVDSANDDSLDYSSIQMQFAQQLQITPGEINNIALYTFVNDWLNTPYKYAGRSKNGVDCSDFTELLYKNVYDKNIDGNAKSLFQQIKPVKKDELAEGDLVFFKIKKGRISHVGIYLANNKFVHASVHSGVTISDLNDTYYKKYFYRGGRMKS